MDVKRKKMTAKGPWAFRICDWIKKNMEIREIKTIGCVNMKLHMFSQV